jgi:transcription elongation factor GreB
MSKAFTKDDGPATPEVARRRAPLPAEVPNYVTARGLLALRAELAALGGAGAQPAAHPTTGAMAATTERPDVTTETSALAARRAELERRIATATLAPPPADPGEIRFGARVTLRAADGATRDVRIVGVDEAAPASGLVAFVAPLARALLGRRAGEVATVRTPRGEDALEILAVTYDE